MCCSEKGRMWLCWAEGETVGRVAVCLCVGLLITWLYLGNVKFLMEFFSELLMHLFFFLCVTA